ncbi:MAG: phosphoserine phosphatase SerB [Candidatus Nitrosoabyssus spongiisocia]|nr:MAG: phosphoserine phosphatase SerB [Nitrosopumilaceae archaeon AB1(1)]
MLAIFDIEGVLYDAEYLPLLAEKVGKQDEIWDITNKGIRGEIDWEEGLRTRVNALRGIKYNTCVEVADSLPIMKGAAQVCKVLKDAGWKIMAVSGGFTIMTDRLEKILGLDHVYSNKLLFKDNSLDDVEITVGADKAKSVRSKIGKWNVKKEDIVVIADGANDIKLFDLCGLSIAFRAQEIIQNKANYEINETDLARILPIINKHYNLNLG